MEFLNIQDFFSAFIQGRMVELPKHLTIGGIAFHQHAFSSCNCLDVLMGQEFKICYVPDNCVSTRVLSPDANTCIQYIVLIMSRDNNSLAICPSSVQIVRYPKESHSHDGTGAVINTPLLAVSEGDKSPRDDLGDDYAEFNKEAKSEKSDDSDTEKRKTLLKISTKRIVGEEVDATIIGFNHGVAIRGKIDTGADMSSIHAENIKIIDTQDYDSPMVKFTYGDSVYTMPLHDKVAVQSSDNAEGVEYRPVVQFDVKIHDRLLSKVSFNLNDRSDMPFKLLIGKNLLTKGSFLIDPKLEEEVEWTVTFDASQLTPCAIAVPVLPSNDQPPTNLSLPVDELTPTPEVSHEEQVCAVYEFLMMNENVSLGDIMRHAKTLAYKTMESLEH